MASQPYAPLECNLDTSEEPEHGCERLNNDNNLDFDSPSKQVPQGDGSAINLVGAKAHPHKRVTSAAWTGHWSVWKWECCACLLALVALFGVLVTLLLREGKPLPQWPLDISINTLLSIYSMVLKASLMFVLASCVGQLQWAWFSSPSGRPLYDMTRYIDGGHGPLGALDLLRAQHVRQPLAAVGAIIVIAAVALDPLTQAIVIPFDCSTVTEGANATLPRTNYFSVIQQNQALFTREMGSSIFSGAMAVGSTVAGQCPTGNCTFSDVYTTLGYCSYCKDSSAEINITRTCSDDEWFSRVRDDGLTDTYGCPRGSLITINSGLPTGLNLTTSWSTTRGPLGSFPVATMTYNGDGSIQILVGKTLYSEQGLDITTGELIQGCGDATSDTWDCRGYGAATCTLEPCVRMYNSTITNGRMDERLIGQSERVAWDHSLAGLGLVDTECISEDAKAILVELGYKFLSSQRWLPFHATGPSETLEPSILARSLMRSKCLYLLNLYYITDYMSPIFDNGAMEVSGFNRHTNPPTLQGMVARSFSGPELLQQIFNLGYVDFDRVQQIFFNISESMTQHIRQNGNGSFSEPAQGQIFHYATCLRVHWELITFPACLVAFTLFFFVAVVESRESDGVPVWKSSTLAWVFRGPPCDELEDNKNQRRKEGLHTSIRMYEHAKTLFVRLRKSDARIEIVKTQNSRKDVREMDHPEAHS